jgi:hypothetical protein
MTYDDLKLWVTNMLVISITFTQLENILKIVLLVISIGYTIDKWINRRKNKQDDNE